MLVLGSRTQFRNGTAAQLGYTVPFTSVHAGEYHSSDVAKKGQWVVAWFSGNEL